MYQGLNTEEVAERQSKFGFNELESARPKNILRIVVEVMREPMFLLLIACGVLYLMLGDVKEGVVLMCSILIIITITFIQYRKTERALEALRNMASPRALVIRNGEEIRIGGREVVPDDIIILNEGDRIPADSVLLTSTNFTVDESLLTGESVPVRKEHVTSDKIFSGTLVVQGKALARVTHTGMQTEFGKIGSSLESIEQEDTRLQQEMKVFIQRIFVIGICISVGIVIAFYLQRGNLIGSLLNGLAAAMGILPEEFPVVMTIFLALGSWRLSKKNVLTRKSSAIETLGSATVLCSDKTGTITQNKMSLEVVWTNGETTFQKNFNQENTDVLTAIKVGYMASHADTIDPMEKSIRQVFTERLTGKVEPAFIRDYPISRELLAMTHVYKKTNDAGFDIMAKGAPEAIMSLCGLDEQQKNKLFQTMTELGEQGYRLIGVADGTWDQNDLPADQRDFKFQFRGLLGFADPIRPEVPAAIKECRDAGVKVVMITGDYPVTARAIGQHIGMDKDSGLMTGEELDALSDQALKERIRSVNIFARVVPEQKLRIVNAFKANGEVVAMTGDGVNDAPALKAANIGVAMGAKGTDVAREASSLVLLDDNFASIVSAIRSGRRIFDNLQKAMTYILAIHLPIIGLTILPAFFENLPILLFPVHIVFLELIIDPVCSIAFEAEPEEYGIMNRRPRNPAEKFFGSKRILKSMFKGFLLLTIVIIVYMFSINEGHSEGEVRAIAFSTLIIGNIFLILSELSRTHNFLNVFHGKNKIALTILAIATAILLLTISTPSLNYIFNFSFPGYRHFVPALIGAGSMLLILEVLKYVDRKKGRPI